MDFEGLVDTVVEASLSEAARAQSPNIDAKHVAVALLQQPTVLSNVEPTELPNLAVLRASLFGTPAPPRFPPVSAGSDYIQLTTDPSIKLLAADEVVQALLDWIPDQPQDELIQVRMLAQLLRSSGDLRKALSVAGINVQSLEGRLADLTGTTD